LDCHHLGDGDSGGAGRWIPEGNNCLTWVSIGYGVGFAFTHRPWVGFKRGLGALTGVSGRTGSPRLEQRVPAWSRSHAVWQPEICGSTGRLWRIERLKAASPKLGGDEGAILSTAAWEGAGRRSSNFEVWHMPEKRVTRLAASRLRVFPQRTG
jgi:hypothetical protein